MDLEKFALLKRVHWCSNEPTPELMGDLTTGTCSGENPASLSGVLKTFKRVCVATLEEQLAMGPINARHHVPDLMIRIIRKFEKAFALYSGTSEHFTVHEKH